MVEQAQRGEVKRRPLAVCRCRLSMPCLPFSRRVQAAIEELTRRDPGMKSWQAKDGVMKGMFQRERGE